jgi:hypothetical protein
MSATGRLWVANLLGPAAALLGLEAAYALVRPACAMGRMLPVHLAFLAVLMLALWGGALGWREGRSARLAPPARLLARLAMAGGVFFALTIALQWSAAMFIRPCQ